MSRLLGAGVSSGEPAIENHVVSLLCRFVIAGSCFTNSHLFVFVFSSIRRNYMDYYGLPTL